MSPYGAVRGVLAYERGAYYAEKAGSISFVHASRGCHSGVVNDPVIIEHDAAVLGNFLPTFRRRRNYIRSIEN